MPGNRGKIQSDAERRYLFAAESRGELPKGKAREMAHRVKGKHLPERVSKKKVKKNQRRGGRR